MYLVARTLHGVRCSQCVYRWLVKSILCVRWSISRVVRSDEEGKVARASAHAKGVAGIWMLRDATRGGLEEGVGLHKESKKALAPIPVPKQIPFM
jgi:hypothetical protein